MVELQIISGDGFLRVKYDSTNSVKALKEETRLLERNGIPAKLFCG